MHGHSARLIVPALLCFGLGMAGCDSDEGPGPIGICGDLSIPAPIVRGAEMLFFADPVHTDLGPDGAARAFLTAVRCQGLVVDTFSYVSAEKLDSVLAGRFYMLMPPLKDGTAFLDSLSPAAESIFADFIRTNGFMIAAGTAAHAKWLGPVLGLEFTVSMPLPANQPLPRSGFYAPGTWLSSGPETLHSLPSTTLLQIPAGQGFEPIYEGPSGASEGAVALITVDEGLLLFLGWDWSDNEPQGTAAKEWEQVLQLTVDLFIWP